jgi:NADP-dependent 3-hydroxy acid dehydrogenase YdfG
MAQESKRQGHGRKERIGEATAEALAEAGAKVVATGRREERPTELVTRLDKAGHCVLALPSDIADKAAAPHMIARAADRYGPVEILVNNARSPRSWGPTPNIVAA